MGFLFKKSGGDKGKKDQDQVSPSLDKKKRRGATDGAEGASKTSDEDEQATSSSDSEGADSSSTPTYSPKSTKKRQSAKRSLSSNSMRKIRELAACLQIMGDDMERKRLSGAYSIQDPLDYKFVGKK